MNLSLVPKKTVTMSSVFYKASHAVYTRWILPFGLSLGDCDCNVRQSRTWALPSQSPAEEGNLRPCATICEGHHSATGKISHRPLFPSLSAGLGMPLIPLPIYTNINQDIKLSFYSYFQNVWTYFNASFPLWNCI